METLVDVVGLALVSKVALAVVVQKILVEGFHTRSQTITFDTLQQSQYFFHEDGSNHGRLVHDPQAQ